MFQDLVPFLIILTIGLALLLSAWAAWRSWHRDRVQVRTEDLARAIHEGAHDGVAGPLVEWEGVAQKERERRRAQARYLLRHFQIGPLLLCALVFGGCASQRLNAARLVVASGADAVTEVSAEFDRLDREKQVGIATAAPTKEDGDAALKAYRQSHLKWWQAVRDLEKGVLALLGDVVGPRRLSEAEIRQKQELLKTVLREPLQVLEGAK